MSRVTEKILDYHIGILNGILTDYNITVKLDIANGGYKLVQKLATGGYKELSSRLSAREMYECINSIENLLNVINYNNRGK